MLFCSSNTIFYMDMKGFNHFMHVFSFFPLLISLFSLCLCHLMPLILKAAICDIEIQNLAVYFCVYMYKYLSAIDYLVITGSVINIFYLN